MGLLPAWCNLAMIPSPRRAPALALAFAAAFALAACDEIPQNAMHAASKPARDAAPYAAAPFNGDKAKYEAALAERARVQDDYQRIPK